MKPLRRQRPSGIKGQQVMIPTPEQPDKYYGSGAVNYHTGESGFHLESCVKGCSKQAGMAEKHAQAIHKI
jgi:hypothetical protein